MSDVFISYSRNNSKFAHKLTDRLEEKGKTSWVDWIGIPKTAPNWWVEIKAGIENSDSFVFIMSPDSMASVVCNLEVDYAIELGKRIIPIAYREIETKEAFASVADYQPDEAMRERLQGKDTLVMARDNWNRLSHINWILCKEDDDFDKAFEDLIKSVETDLAYVKAHTHYLTRTGEWERNDKRTDLLLFGEEIDRGEAWLVKAEKYATKQSSDKEDIVNPLAKDNQREYIEKSRQEDTRRKHLARSAQLSIAVLAIVLIGGAIIGFTALNGLNQQIDSANSQLAEATEALVEVNTLVADANEQLSAVPPTLTEVNGQVIFAQQEADIAGTQVGLANNQLATATQALVTATRVAELEAEGQATLGVVSTLVADSIVTVTQAAINYEIVNQFANVILQEDGNPTIQLQVMNDLIEQYPEEAIVYSSRGLVYSSAGEYGQAIADYTRAIELAPGYSTAYNNRGIVYYNQGIYEQAIEDFDRAIELNPEYDMAYYNRGIVFHAQGAYEQAIVDFDRAIELNPDFARAYNNRGLAYDEDGNYEQAIADYTRAIELTPGFVEAYNNRGTVFHTQGAYEQAIADFDRAIELNPDFAEAYYNRGLTYAEDGDYEQAMADYTRTLEFDPGHSEAYNNRGNLYYSRQEYEQAIADYDHAIEFNVENVQAYYNRGNAYRNLEEYEQAIEDYSRVIELIPGFAEAYNNRGASYLFSSNDYADPNRLELALADFSEAIRRGDSFAYLGRGVTHYYLGNYRDTLADFEAYESTGGTLVRWIDELREDAQRIVDEENGSSSLR